jgi:hypothetical protein
MSLQRADAVNVQRAPDAKALGALRGRAESYSEHAGKVGDKLHSTIDVGLRAIEDSQRLMLTTATAYDDAFKRVNDVLGKAGEEFKTTDLILDTTLNVAFATVFGLITGGVSEAAGVTKFAMKVAVEAFADLTEDLEGIAQDKLGFDDARKQRDDALKLSDDLSPTAKRLEVFQKVAEAYRELATVGLNAKQISDARHECDVLVGDIKVAEAGGKDTPSPQPVPSANPIPAIKVLTPAQLATATDKAGAGDQKLAEVDASLDKVRDSVNKFKADAQASSDRAKNGRTVEQDIWINYIAGLSDASARNKILDKIEDHLVEVGVLSSDDKAQGVLKADFGDYTSQDDTDHAGLEALELATRREQDALGPNQIGKIVTLNYSNGDEGFFSIPGTRFTWTVKSDTQSLIAGQQVKLLQWDPTARKFTGEPPGVKSPTHS